MSGNFNYALVYEVTLFEIIKEDWIAHQRDWTRPGFRAVAFHRFGRWRLTIKHRIFRAPMTLLYRALYRRARSIYGIELPYCIELGRRVIIEHQGAIVIHGNCVIGDDCIIRQGVSMGIKNIDRPNDAPVLGNRVDIGAGAKIIGDITIGDDVVIGANAVVLDDVAAGTTVVGIPAKPVGKKKNISTHSKVQEICMQAHS